MSSIPSSVFDDSCFLSLSKSGEASWEAFSDGTALSPLPGSCVAVFSGTNATSAFSGDDVPTVMEANVSSFDVFDTPSPSQIPVAAATLAGTADAVSFLCSFGNRSLPLHWKTSLSSIRTITL